MNDRLIKITLTCLILGLTGGFNNSLLASTGPQDGKKPLIVASASMLADMAKNIAGDHFRIDLIVPIGGDPHIHEPTPRDAQVVSEADIVFVNGLTFEGWLNELIENSGTRARVYTITKGIKPIESQQYKNATDPHAWMDASNGIIYARNIRDALSAFMPEFAGEFDANFEQYKKELEDLDAYVAERIKSIPPEKRILITSHDAFQYFGRHYGIRLESVLGVSTDADVQTSDINRLNAVISQSEVPAVFIESTINPKLLEQLASDNGIVVGGKLYADSLGDEDSPAPTYIKMLKHNADTIAEALSADRGERPVSGGNSMILIVGLALVALIIGGIVFYFIDKARFSHG